MPLWSKKARSEIREAAIRDGSTFKLVLHFFFTNYVYNLYSDIHTMWVPGTMNWSSMSHWICAAAQYGHCRRSCRCLHTKTSMPFGMQLSFQKKEHFFLLVYHMAHEKTVCFIVTLLQKTGVWQDNQRQQTLAPLRSLPKCRINPLHCKERHISYFHLTVT